MPKDTIEEFDFDWMLAPNTVQSFIDGHLGCQALRIGRTDARYYADLFDEDDLEFALAAACDTRGAVEELLAGDQVRPCRSQVQAVSLYKSGKSLRIVSIQRFSPKISRLCRSITETLQCRVQVNLYLTPGGSKALNKHFDTHDVFVLQVHGAKLWTLYDNPVPVPLEVLPLLRHENVHEMKRHRLVKHRYSPEDSMQKEEFLLRAGELLYLPRGDWHNAQSEPGQVSCHLTIGLQAVTYTDLLTAAIGQASFGDRRMRESLPLNSLTDDRVAGHVKQQLEEIFSTLGSHVNTSVCLGQLGRNLAQSARPATGNGLFEGEAKSSNGVTIDSLVRVRPGLVLALDNSTDPPELCFQNKSFGVASAYLPAVRQIAQSRELQVRHIPGNLDDEQRVLFTKDLITVGLLEVLKSASAERIVSPGWLPMHVNIRARTISWIDCGRDSLPEPFVKQSFERIRANSPHSAIVVTPIRRALAQENMKPSGFVFHVSRCGSTLLSNVIKQIRGARVLSEPQSVSALLQWVHDDTASNGTEIKRRLEIFKAVVEAFGSQPESNKAPFFFKLTSWNLLHLQLFRRLWPEVPCLVLIRDPLEVGVSCMDKPPGWMNWRKQPAPWLASKVESRSVNRETFCAQMLGQFFKTAHEFSGGGVRVVRYDDLDLSTCVNIAAMFGLNPTAEDVEGMQRVLGINAKHPELGNFRADSEPKRQRASDHLEKEINLWAKEAYEQLCVDSKVLL